MAKRKSIIFNLVICLLVVVAAVLAYFLIQPNFLSKKTQIKNSSLSIVNQAIKSESTTNMTPNEQDVILKTPNNLASDQEKSAYSQLVSKFALDSDSINISSCGVKPIVLRTKIDSKITFINSDPTDHEIAIDPERVYKIGANKTEQITIDFSHGEGIYGYGCDKSSKQVGVFLVVK